MNVTIDIMFAVTSVIAITIGHMYCMLYSSHIIMILIIVIIIIIIVIVIITIIINNNNNSNNISHIGHASSARRPAREGGLAAVPADL